MANAIFKVPLPPNEPFKSYAPATPERAALKKQLDEMVHQTIDIPIIIGGKEIRTGDTDKCVCPQGMSHHSNNTGKKAHGYAFVKFIFRIFVNSSRFPQG